MEVGENCYLRTARKDWRCMAQNKTHHAEDCQKIIRRGQQYIECVDSVPMYTSGDRYCLPCSRIQLGSMVDWSLVPA